MANVLRQDIPLGASLTEERAGTLFDQGRDAIVFALLAQAKLLAEQQAALAATRHDTPSIPSGSKPVYTKPEATGRGKTATETEAVRVPTYKPCP